MSLGQKLACYQQDAQLSVIKTINDAMWCVTMRNMDKLKHIQQEIDQSNKGDVSSRVALIVDGLIEELKYKIDLETTIKNLQQHIETLGGTL